MEEDITWPIFGLIDENARATLRSGIPGGILIFSEHLDRAHFPDSAIQMEQLAWIRKKYANSKLDLIIAIGEVPTGLFPGVPLVFLSDDPLRKPPNSVKSATSEANVWVDISAQKTLELAQRLQPGARRIVVIGDGSASEDTYLTRLRSLHPTSAGNVPITYVTNPVIPEICQRVSELRSNNIVIYTGLSRDEHRQPLIPGEVISKIAAASGAPVYAIVDAQIGTGAVGGYVARFAEVGKAGGQLGLRILAGEHPQDVVAQNQYVFDWRQLRRWTISESALPSGSIVVYQQPSVWESYKHYILGGMFLVVVETLLILGLLRQRARRRKIEKSLEDLSGRLITAQDEERTRIARELHDDFSQRLALQGIGLRQLWKKLPESEVEERAKLQELLKRVQEISSDMHSLSRQLHSSKLEHVGLAPALMGLCEELSKEYKIQVEFTDRGVSSEIPKDVALSLFRIAQEALGNVAKHSGAKQAHVELSGTNNEIRLRIVDAGVGFDLAPRSADAGIGLVSMRERLRLVGGRLSVQSAPLRGTEILAEVPLSASRARVRGMTA